jgi:MFS family permease
MRKALWRDITAEWRQHWCVGAAAFFSTAVSLAVWPSVSSLFVQPLQQAFHWSRGQIALSANASLISAALAPFAGRVIDRLGVRPILLTGLVFTAASYFALASMHGSLGFYYTAYGCLATFGLSTTGLTYTRIVASTFGPTRGFALSVNRASCAISGICLPPLLYAVMQSHGWRWGFISLGLLLLMISYPLGWLFPGKESVPKQSAQQSLRTEPASWSTLLRDGRVHILCLAAGLNYAPVVAILSQLQPLLVGHGINPATVSGLVGLASAGALCGGLIAGALVDRLPAHRVAASFMLAPIAGCLMLSHASAPSGAAAAVVLVGVGQGIELDLVAYMIAKYFAARHYSSVYGLTYFYLALLSALSVSAIGLLYDTFKSYQLVLMLAVGSFTAAAFCYLATGKKRAADCSSM